MSKGVDSVPQIQLLGGFSIRLGDATLIDQTWRRRKAIDLVSLLALQRQRSLHREQVFDALWPELEPASAANNLHKNVHYLKTELERDAADAPLVMLSGGAVALDRRALVDVDAFRAAAASARLARTNPRLYTQALALYGGELLPMSRYQAWTAMQRDELSALHGRLVIELSQLHEVRGEWDEALDCLARLGTGHTDEEAYRAIMRIHALSGRADAALRAYAVCRETLKAELDAPPSRRTEALRSDIAQGRIRRRARMAHVPEGPLIGRGPEMGQLVRALTEAFEGAGGLAFISGEPGIGKTRLAEELATHAHLRGAHVLWGRCDQSDAVAPYWPWLQAIQTYVEEAGGGAGVAIDLPGLTRSAHAPTSDVQPEKGRLRLFESVTTLFKLAATSRPVLLVLDDLHDADGASLQLLRHLAREAHDERMIIVVTFRDTELAPEHPLSNMIGELVREHLKARIHLTGLSMDEVAEFVEMTMNADAPSAVVAAIHDETAGNPFFVKECARLAAEVAREGRVRTGVPPSARDAVLRRVERLSPDCSDALAIASVIGRRFERALLLRVAGLSHAALLDVLDEAARTRMIVPHPDRPDVWSFAHGLTHQAIYGRISARRRAELHGRIGEAIEARGDPATEPSELAHHFGEAARGGGDPEKPIGYAISAGETALVSFAWESAISHWETALRLMDEHNADRDATADLHERIETLIFSTGGDNGVAIQHLERARAIRESLGQHDRAAQIGSRLERALSTHVGEP